MIHFLAAQALDNAMVEQVVRQVAEGKPFVTKTEGIGWGSWPTWIGSLFTGGLLAAVLKFGLAWRKQTHDRGDMLDEERRGDMKGMRERIDTLERDAREERERHEAGLRELAREREVERARHDAEMRVMRHRLNNSNQCLDALLLLLETNPEKVAQAVAAVKEMRVRQREAEAIEQAAVHTAVVAAASE